MLKPKYYFIMTTIIRKCFPIFTLAVMSDTALGSGSVLGMLPQSCHMKLQEG